MKKSNISILLTAIMVIVVSNSVFASFEVKNITGGELTVLVSHSHSDYFEYKLVGNNEKFMIDHGVDYIAAWIGRVAIKDVVDGKLAKSKNYNTIRNEDGTPGLQILQNISWDNSASHSTGAQMSLNGSLMHYHEVVPTYAIKKDTNQLSIGITGKEQ